MTKYKPLTDEEAVTSFRTWNIDNAREQIKRANALAESVKNLRQIQKIAASGGYTDSVSLNLLRAAVVMDKALAAYNGEGEG